MNAYEYPPVSGPRCTRLIRLHPGKTKDPACPLSCELDEIDMDNPPDYLALSYTWNGETPSEPLLIGSTQADNSPTAGSQLLITPNCAAALRAFRKSLHRRFNRRKSLKLWVDAICINQGSNNDKSTQVALMAEIFQRAKRVVVWLGARDSPLSLRPLVCSSACAMLPNVDLGRLRYFFAWTERLKALRWFTPQFERLETLVADAVLICCDRSTVRTMSHSSYWTRAWTAQEFCNARISILCQNSKMISCVGILRMIYHESRVPELRPPTLHRHLYETCRISGNILYDLMLLNHHSMRNVLELQASEPRDKIFAFRSLCPMVCANIEVDYRRPLQDLFTEASMIVIKESNRLYLLYFASLEKTSGGTTTGLMPSWSLDFGTRDFHEGYRGAHMAQGKNSKASLGSPAWISFPGPRNSLRVLGRSVGVIGSFISNFDPVGNPLLMVRTSMREQTGSGVADDHNGRVSASEGQSRDYQTRLMETMEHFVSIICRKLGTNVVSETKMVETFVELMKSVVRLANFKPVYIPSLAPNVTFRDLLDVLYDDSDLSRRFKYDIGEGRLFFTTDQRAGLGVPRIAEGDEIFLIAGLEHPFVLRPHASNGEYTLVGPAIVTGMMEGELWPDDESELRGIDIV